MDSSAIRQISYDNLIDFTLLRETYTRFKGKAKIVLRASNHSPDHTANHKLSS